MSAATQLIFFYVLPIGILGGIFIGWLILRKK